MKKMKIIILYPVFTLIFISSILLSASFAFNYDNSVEIDLSYLALYNAMSQRQEMAIGKRQQFDGAANLGMDWYLCEYISSRVEFFLGAGKGSLGLAGPAAVADLCLEIQIPSKFMALTFGTIDLPFGVETECLSDNANTINNSFIVNSLLYNGLASPVSIPGAIGVQGRYIKDQFDVTAAVGNGMSGDASNPDGGFLFAGRVAITSNNSIFQFAASALKSEDRTDYGTSGFGVNLTGWLSEGSIRLNSHNYLKGYFGQLVFGDFNRATKDGVNVWMGELGFNTDFLPLVFRASGWIPDDANGNGKGISHGIPNPGLGLEAEKTRNPQLFTDQIVNRYQIAANYPIFDELIFKMEVLIDDYNKSTLDVTAFIIGLNGQFCLK